VASENASERRVPFELEKVKEEKKRSTSFGEKEKGGEESLQRKLVSGLPRKKFFKVFKEGNRKK